MKIKIIGATAFVAASVLLVGCGGDKEEASTPAANANKVQATAPSGDRMAIAKGTVKFAKTCATCHNADAKGMPNLGKDLTISEFFRDSTNEELVEFVKVGRPATETTVAMPPKGGFTDLTDEDILNVIKYVRTLQQ